MTPLQGMATQDLDLKILASVIYEFNISRRNSISYPPGHPVIASAAEKAVLYLQKLLEHQPAVTLGIARNTLIFNSGVLDRKNAIFADFAGYLFSFGIAAISIGRGLTPAELVTFFTTLGAGSGNVHARGGAEQLLKNAGIMNIEVSEIDYESFHVTEEESVAIPGSAVLEQETEALWSRFVEGVVHGNLDADGKSVITGEHIDPERLAAFMNERAPSRKAASGGLAYDRAITTFMRELDQDMLAEKYDAESVQKLAVFVKNLSPELRHQFLESSFDALDGGKPAKKLLAKYPDGAILNAIEEVSREGSGISEGVMNLLQLISKSGGGSGKSHRPKMPDGMNEEDLSRKLQDIFREDETGQSLSEDYRATLKAISSIERLTVLSQDEIRSLSAQMQMYRTEPQVGEIILQVIESGLQQEGDVLQRNLLDLCGIFLETGDFHALSVLHTRLNASAHAGGSVILPIYEAVLARFSEPDFLEEVLNGLTVWGKSIYDEIRGIILNVGEPFVEPLINRLSDETNLSLRRFYLDCLGKIGPVAIAAAARHLNDGRWYVVRNMVVLIRSFGDPRGAVHFRTIADHPHPKVRLEVIKTLYAFHHPEADRLLAREFQSSDTGVILTAIQLAEHSRDPVIYDCLRKFLQIKLGANVEQEQLKAAAIKALGKIGNTAILPELDRILKQKSLFSSAPLKHLKLAIIHSLGDYPALAAAPLLEYARKSGGELAEAAEAELKRFPKAST